MAAATAAAVPEPHEEQGQGRRECKNEGLFDTSADAPLPLPEPSSGLEAGSGSGSGMVGPGDGAKGQVEATGAAGKEEEGPAEGEAVEGGGGGGDGERGRQEACASILSSLVACVVERAERRRQCIERIASRVTSPRCALLPRDVALAFGPEDAQRLMELEGDDEDGCACGPVLMCLEHLEGAGSRFSSLADLSAALSLALSALAKRKQGVIAYLTQPGCGLLAKGVTVTKRHVDRLFAALHGGPALTYLWDLEATRSADRKSVV